MKQIINPIFLMNRTAHKIAQRVGPNTYVRSSGGLRNLANDWIRDLDNWSQPTGVTKTLGDFAGRSGVWEIKNIATSGITPIYDYTAEESNGGPVLSDGQAYDLIVQIYSVPGTEEAPGVWYTTDRQSGAERAWSPVESEWKTLTTEFDSYAAGKRSFLNAGNQFNVAVGDIAYFDMSTLVIRAV